MRLNAHTPNIFQLLPLFNACLAPAIAAAAYLRSKPFQQLNWTNCAISRIVFFLIFSRIFRLFFWHHLHNKHAHTQHSLRNSADWFHTISTENVVFNRGSNNKYTPVVFAWHAVVSYRPLLEQICLGQYFFSVFLFRSFLVGRLF